MRVTGGKKGSMSNCLGTVKILFTLGLAGLILAVLPSVAAPMTGTSTEGELCLGQISGLAVVAGELLVGTQAGLFRWSEEPARRLEPVGGLDPQPVKKLLRDGDDLILTWGNLTAMRFGQWDGARHAFAVQSPMSPSPADPLQFFKGFPVSGQADLAGAVCTGTLGGGLFLGERSLQGGPQLVTAVVAWQGGIAIGSSEGLYFLAPGGSPEPLFENPCQDCRITCLARWRGEVFAGTLNGGLLRLPGYQAIVSQGGLTDRINALAATPERLFVGTESGLYSWDGRRLIRESVLGDESVKALVADNYNLYLSTLSGLKRFHPDSGRLDVLSTCKGAFLALFRGDLYVGGMFGVWKVNLTQRFAVTRILHENVTGFAGFGGNLYAAGYYNSLWRLAGTGGERVADGQFSAIAAVPGGLLLGTGGAGLIFCDPATGMQHLPDQPLGPKATITALLGGAGAVYVGTPTGYARMPWAGL